MTLEPSITNIIFWTLVGLVLKTAWCVGVIAGGIVVSRFIKWGNG